MNTLPRDDGSDTPIYDATTDLDSLTYPSTFDTDELANAKLWVKQQQLTAKCMATKGFDYTYKLWWERSSTDKNPEALYPMGSPGYIAEYGQPSDGAYDWQTAGCSGYASHQVGTDHAN